MPIHVLRWKLGVASLLLATGWAESAAGADKNGLAPTAISLPDGPGSLAGFGGSYAWMPGLSRGSAGYSGLTKIAFMRPE